MLPFAWASVRHQLEALGVPGTPRRRDGRLETSDNGNALVDCRVGPLADPAGLDRALHAIPGLLETGLFLDLRATIVIERDRDLEIRAPGGDA